MVETITSLKSTISKLYNFNIGVGEILVKKYSFLTLCIIFPSYNRITNLFYQDCKELNDKVVISPDEQVINKSMTILVYRLTPKITLKIFTLNISNL